MYSVKVGNQYAAFFVGIFMFVSGIHCVRLSSVFVNAVECSSSKDLSFQFIGYNNNLTVNLAECLKLVTSCRLMEESFSENYTISVKANGGILMIINLGEYTYGTYKCCEMYNPENCNSTEIMPNAIDVTTRALPNTTVPNAIDVTTRAIPSTTEIEISSSSQNVKSDYVSVVLILSASNALMIILHLTFFIFRSRMLLWRAPPIQSQEPMQVNETPRGEKSSDTV
ncbi:hypothetical protein DPMN_119133 [Dreissena polymorpha]|uniref:Uncharacterized protein n=1 Tax=Dreissena polymorpha TaxID=45954 RepID=A0A9D4JP51_DREPO|nr:hypothetical protein DPMN_119133 [Dreissena polymorpha]